MEILLTIVGVIFAATLFLGIINKDDNASMIYWDEEDW